MTRHKYNRASVAVLLTLAFPIIAYAYALLSPAVAADEGTSAQQQSTETVSQLVQRLSTEGMTELTHFTTNYSPREYWSEEEKAAADYIEGKMKDLSGYTVTVQSFEINGPLVPVSTLSLVSPNARDLRSKMMKGSATGDVTAALVAVGKALEDDIPDTGLTGKIALIERGDITFAEKVNRVEEAGAVGALIYNSEDRVFRNEQPLYGDLTSEVYDSPSIPVAGIWRSEGLTILSTLNGGTEIRARLKVSSEKYSSRNIIAEKAGSDSNADVVVVGAHYDTTSLTQGANDNGTGVASLLVLADELADQQLAHTVRFIFFGSKESGVSGSRYYVENLSESEGGKIIAMLNFDALGSGKPAVVTSGSKELTDWAVNTYAQQNSLNVRFWGPEGTLNDHYYFIDNLEVPAIMFLGDDLSVIDSSLDVIDLVDSSIMGTHMAIALEMIKQAPSVASSATSSLSTDATLSGLELSSVGFSTFDSETTSYTASVANSVTETTVTPTLNHSGASYVTKLNGVTDSDGTISLAVGSNIITVVVTAEDDSTTKTYTVTVTRDAPPSNDATLSNLTLIRIDFGTFGPETTSYTASVANSVTETTVTPISNHAGATYVIKLNDVTDSDGIIPLAVGSNVITVVVTAEDDTTTKTYTVTVTRTLPAPDRDATLSNLTLSGVDIGTFDPATTSYFVKVPNRVSQTTVSPTLNDSDATYVIKRNGVTDPDGTVSLATGRNHIMVKVTADDDETVKLYHVTVFRSPAPAADMGELPTDNPAVNFRATRKSHNHVSVAWSVPNGRGITELEQQRFYHDGTEYVVSGVDGPYTDVSTGGSEYTVNSAYADPDTLYKFVLTLKNASDTAVIVSSFTVRTLPAPDRDATLSNLTLSGVDIGTFDPATTSYFVKVPNRVSQTTVSPTLNDSDATYVIKRNGVTDPDGTVSLATGRNHIMVKVTADDDETVKLYHVTVFRSPAPAADMGELPTDNPAVNFRATRKSHNHVSVAWSVPNGRSITKHELQRFYHDGTEYVASGVDGPYTAASAGGNEYTVSSVNADPDTLYKFVLTLKNASDTAVIVSSFTVRTLPVPDRDATLSNLTLSNVDFGTFTSGTTSYAASVANSVTQTTVTPTLNDSDATYVIKRNGVTDSDGTISLAVGQNIITVVVTADDNSTTNSYTVIVNRTELAMLSKYDTNGDGQINKAEVMTAIGDYLFGAGQITKAEVIEIIDAYLFG